MFRTRGVRPAPLDTTRYACRFPEGRARRALVLASVADWAHPGRTLSRAIIKVHCAKADLGSV
jgi:hypothetical protein